MKSPQLSEDRSVEKRRSQMTDTTTSSFPGTQVTKKTSSDLPSGSLATTSSHFDEDDEEKKVAQLRKRNAVYSKRKYYKKKKEVERLEVTKYKLETSNQHLRLENKRLELLIQDAQKSVVLNESMERILQAKHPTQSRLLPMPSARGSSTQGLLAGLIPQQSGSRCQATLPAAMHQLPNQEVAAAVAPSVRQNAINSSRGLIPSFLHHPSDTDLLERALRAQRERFATENVSLEQRLRAAEVALVTSQQQEQHLMNLLSGSNRHSWDGIPHQVSSANTHNASILASLLLQQQRETNSNRMAQEQQQQQQDLLSFLSVRQQLQRPLPPHIGSNSTDAMLQFLLSRGQQQGSNPPR